MPNIVNASIAWATPAPALPTVPPGAPLNLTVDFTAWAGGATVRQVLASLPSGSGLTLVDQTGSGANITLALQADQAGVWPVRFEILKTGQAPQVQTGTVTVAVGSTGTTSGTGGTTGTGSGGGTGGGGAPPASGSYTLPVATTSTLGGVKQGTGTTIASDGTLSVAAPLALGTAVGTAAAGNDARITGAVQQSAIPASAPLLGTGAGGAFQPVTLSTSFTLASGALGLKLGGGLTVASDGTISAAGGSGVALPSGAALLGTTAGGAAQAIILGSGLVLTGTTLTAPGSATYTLPPATSSALGGVKAGAGLAVAADGTLSVSYSYTLTGASIATALGYTPADAAALATVQGVANAALPKAGGTITGSLQVNYPSAGIEIGSTTTASASYIDFHSSGTAADYDVRLIATGGSATMGQGGLSILGSGGLTVQGPLTLGANPTAALGAATKQYVDAAVPALATAATPGISKPDGSSILINASGIISAPFQGVMAVLTGNGTATNFTITHNLNNINVIVQVLDPANQSATYGTLIPRRPTANTVTFTFTTAPAASVNFVVLIIPVIIAPNASAASVAAA